MVSITFDEFHAVRSRQRAAAIAASRSAPAKGSNASSTSTKPVPSTTQSEGTTQGSAKGKIPVDDNDDRLDAAASQSRAPSSTTLGANRSLRATASGDSQEQQHDAAEHQLQPGFGVASLGRFVELFEVQVAVVIIIFMDLVASTAQLLPVMQQSTAGNSKLVEAGGRLVLRLMQSFTGFTIVLFAIEVAVLLATFRRKFFRHMGYVLDLVVVSLCLYHELAGLGKGVRLLGAIRVWRVARLMNTMFLAADRDHNATRGALREQEKHLQEFEVERRRLQESLRREVDARRRTDKMLRGYKDEVETLNEALRIAALDIAKARVSGDTGAPAGDAPAKIPGLEPGGSASTDPPAEAKRKGEGDSEGSSAADEGLEIAAEKSEKRSSLPPAHTGRIFVFKDGTFQAR